MNDERRKKLNEAISCLNQANQLVDEVKNDEQESYENLPESMQQGDKGNKIEEAVDYLDNAISSIEYAVSNIEAASE